VAWRGVAWRGVACVMKRASFCVMSCDFTVVTNESGGNVHHRVREILRSLQR